MDGMDLLNGVEAVIFDLDGSLVDSMWIWYQIDVEYLGRYGLSVPQDLQRAIEGFSFSETAEYFKMRFALPDPVEEIKRVWNRMALDKYIHQVPLKPGAGGFLELRRRRGVRLGVAPRKFREVVGGGAGAARRIRRDAMGASGLEPYEFEGWHFAIAPEPYPDTYLDFPIK